MFLLIFFVFLCVFWFCLQLCVMFMRWLAMECRKICEHEFVYLTYSICSQFDIFHFRFCYLFLFIKKRNKLCIDKNWKVIMYRGCDTNSICMVIFQQTRNFIRLKRTLSKTRSINCGKHTTEMVFILKPRESFIYNHDPMLSLGQN